ncbi:hypothetical protein [Pseudooceanicola nanhaiensis]|uniref:hypothetical protein n=1 Tax=Pseudooceanicola nanhaiensis TaxID=375761 RepID=UPI001CD46BCF|nr:hypothetical protein [Pseudooceanicola nanhaiensis]MCA0919059.1 hypothetical protein [Pseudooceanicola nanhaiensis]
MGRKGLTALLPALLCLAGSAQAGAWPRGEGSQFISVSYRLHVTPEHRLHTMAYYHELGFSETGTLVLDIGQSVNGDPKAIAALRYVLLPERNDRHLAWDVGLGRIGEAATVRVGAAYGKGFAWARGRGWFNLDVAGYSTPGFTGAHLQMDVTFGLSFGDGPKVYAQILSGKPHGDSGLAWLGASAAIPLRPGLRLDLGLFHEVVSGDEYRLKLGVWKEF